ncbi:MAG: hypothetical protein Q9181_005650 [Wetmoreana brouardii]
MSDDPLILAQLQLLAFWLNGDDGDELREEAVSILDVILGFSMNMGGEFLDLKCSTALLATQLAMCSRKNELEHGTEALKRLREVSQGLLAAPQRLDEDTQKELLDAIITLEQLKI